VECLLCPNRCVLAPGQTGFCRNFQNQGGTLRSLVYGKPCSVGVELIEKAPLYHVLPGGKRLCVATTGCNMRCKFCQNWQISQCSVGEVDTQSLTPAQIVETAQREGVPIICFTFTEPVNFYDYMYDICRLAKPAGIKTVMISNGYINPEPMRALLPWLDAVKIDLKGFTDKFYQEVTSGKLGPVLETMKTIKAAGVHLEIVNLVVPTMNDKRADVKRMCDWIVKELGPDVPLHFTRFHPDYKLRQLPPTPPATLDMAAAVAKKAGIKYVYIGNLPGSPLNSTYCPACGALLIERVGMLMRENSIKDGKCPKCGQPIPGVWQ